MMRNRRKRSLSPAIICVLFLAGMALFLIACGQTEAPPTAVPTSPPATVTPMAQTLAALGQEIFADKCAVCHGQQGQGVTGPAIIGLSAGLEKYNTGQGLFDYISGAMPKNAPGSLTNQQYLEVVAFLLLENGYVQADAPLNMERLDQIQLE
jgi:mono/diheme cytochrome c family protein